MNVLTQEGNAGWTAGTFAGVVGAVHRGVLAAGASNRRRAGVLLAVVGATDQVPVNRGHDTCQH